MERRAHSRRLPRVHQGPLARAGRWRCDALGDHQGAVPAWPRRGLKPADAALHVRTGDHVVAVECWWEVPGERKAPPAGALEARPSPAAGRSDARGRQGRAVHNVYVDQHRGALIVVWAAQMGRSMSARASALDVVGAITRDAPEPAFPLQSWRLPGVVLLRRRLAPGRAVGGESYEGGHNDEV